MRSYGPVLDRLFSAGVSEHFLYSFDVSLDETLRRHRTRVTTDCGFTEDDMRVWYPHAHPWGHELEQLIPESASIDDIVAQIRRDTLLATDAETGPSPTGNTGAP